MSQTPTGAAAMTQSKWHTLFEGSGSATGNDWLEEVCYLGDEQWLLSLRDDPAWSGDELDVQEPEDHTSASLVEWVVDMDGADEDEDRPRTQALLEIAVEEGAKECEALLREHLARPDDAADEKPRSSMAEGWASGARMRAAAARRSVTGDDSDG